LLAGWILEQQNTLKFIFLSKIFICLYNITSKTIYMGKEQIIISKHHADGIKKQTDVVEKHGLETYIQMGLILSLSRLTFPDSTEPLYPHLSPLSEMRKFAELLIIAYRSVLAGNYTEVPDYNPDAGTQNFDYICQGCYYVPGPEEPQLCKLVIKIQQEDCDIL